MRLIDADTLQYEIGIENDCVPEAPLEMLKRIARKIDNAPTIEAEPVRHGNWINEKSDIGYYFAEYDYECSLCGGHTGFSRYPQSRYCQNCGAKMTDEVSE